MISRCVVINLVKFDKHRHLPAPIFPIKSGVPKLHHFNLPYKHELDAYSFFCSKKEWRSTSYKLKKKPHVVCIPYPAQGHINPMLKLAKVLHFKGGFHVTFVHTEHSHKRLLKARGPDSLNGLPSFRFETIPDGLPAETDVDVTQDRDTLCESIRRTCLPHFKNLLSKFSNASSDVPPVSCIVSDGVMSFTLDAAIELNIPEVLFWTTSACGFMGYVQYRQLIIKGLIPIKGITLMNFISTTKNGFIDAHVRV
ncbi:7-deoxyloganetin glucosyltransferase-like [Lotus japonicus]|uniref:7-deoxyloganetin glucosyltransferase-like n=1 Tax=Lotus japonicus TaxID=34305 RepID=UPI00258E4B47|nr:7-deoxyloganetin glucosyltransferase-like [Lotus japonicus]